MKKHTIIIGLLALVLAGCQSKITGSLALDGTPFKVRECRSGQAFGFYGIELTDESDRRLRLFGNPDGTCTAALFKSGSASGDTLGRCGTLKVTTQSSRINSIYNVMGTAQLACETSDHKLSGNLDFENCH